MSKLVEPDVLICNAAGFASLPVPRMPDEMYSPSFQYEFSKSSMRSVIMEGFKNNTRDTALAVGFAALSDFP